MEYKYKLIKLGILNICFNLHTFKLTAK